MTPKDILDRAPLIPIDYANHIADGGFLGLIVLAVLTILGLAHAALFALLTVFLVVVAKKLFDYYREHETVATCVAKVVVTCLWPASVWIVVLFRLA